jgi:hypothetical protein
MISVFIKDNLEDIMQELYDYIDSTYSEHYSSIGIQTIDKWEARGTLVSTALDMAEKYGDRYGKKEGYNKKDILKAIHFLIMVYAANHFAEAKKD